MKGSNIYITCLYIVYILCGLIMLYLWCECCCVACELRNYRLARSRVSKFHSLILFRFFDGRIQKRRERETMKGRGPFHFFRPFNRRPYSRRPSLITPAHMVVKTFVVSLSRSPERIHARRTRRWRRACCYFWFRRSNSTFDVGAIRERLIRVYRTALADPEGEPIGFTKHHLLLLVSSPTLSLSLLL